MPKSRLRQNVVRRLPYSGSANSQCIYWDDGLAGFGLRVFPNERRVYVCSYRVQKRKRLATLGRSDVLTLAAARKKAKGYLGQVAHGVDPKAASDAAGRACTLRALVTTYVERHAKPKKTSWRKDESILDRLLVPKLGSRVASSLTSADIALLHADIGKETPYQANRLVAVVKKMYNVGKIWGLVPPTLANPASGIERFAEQKRRRYVTPTEMPKLVTALDADINDFASHALWLLLLTGLRRSELLRAKWSDVEWKQRALHVGRTKNGEALLAPLSHAAIKRLRLIPRLENNEYIFCGSIVGSPIAYLDSTWRRIRKATGLHDLRIHDLRRTVGSWLVRDGASLHLVGAVLNHKDQKTTAGYAYFQTKDRHRALDKHGRNIAKATTLRTYNGGSETPNGATDTVFEVKPIVYAKTLAREDLYKKVWSEPMTKLALSLGISDVGLAKICRRANVPVPERGYWARIAAGQPIKRPPLPPRQEGMRDYVRFKASFLEPSRLGLPGTISCRT